MKYLWIHFARVTAIVLVCITTISPLAQEQSTAVPLYADLGDLHFPISTAVPLAQQYFDQGMRLYYAFNHAEAIRAFKEAQRLDDNCAICWWGEALAWGPNINLIMDTPSGLAAFAASEQAKSRLSFATAKEAALINALEVRYAAQAPENRAHLDQAYADAMAEVVSNYRNDIDIAVLYAEALMDLRPWNYWSATGEPQPGMDVALDLLQQAMADNENHPGACHFYIHAVEAVYPERAIPCAERLAGLMPGAGHLVHMPGHIYIRVGRYMDAVAANEHAVHADESFIQDQNPVIGMYTVGYYPHNYDFMAFAAMMIGCGELAIDSANKATSLLPPEMFGTAGMDFLQHWLMRPLQMQVRFARWDDILTTQRPPENYSHAMGIWHYARGRAYLAKGDTDEANEELNQLRAVAADTPAIGLKMEFNQSADLLKIAERILTGWRDAEIGAMQSAVASLQQAVEFESRLLYGEPPEWSVPPRQDLGAVLLLAGLAAESEQVFRDDLTKFPENGWSLHGLQQALAAQGKLAEAQAVKATLDNVWATADAELDGSYRFVE